MGSTFVSSDLIRARFARAMSDMFRTEVPAYGTLVDLVEKTNDAVLATDKVLAETLARTDGKTRISQERHGAIRLGKPEELSMMRRAFAVMGMHPVGYYDLSVAGIPVHSTAFRPLDHASLSANPFRVFCSLLRLDLIENEELRAQAENALSSREIFSLEAVGLIETAEDIGGLDEEQAERFVAEVLETFRWHNAARIDETLFERLLSAHRLIADVVSFKGPHINHLTPRTLDIDAVQAAMPKHGIDPKAVVEGPPARECPILLRQTSFKALTEAIRFPDGAGGWSNGRHTARFGEIEARGAALTPKGRALYDSLLDEVRREIVPAPDGSNAADYMDRLDAVFAAFPDDWSEMRDEGLAYFYYYPTGEDGDATSLETLVASGAVGFAPVVYEDFLPVSAAGIFQSNLGDDRGTAFGENANQALFEQALGAPVGDPFKHYAAIEAGSIAAIKKRFGCTGD